MIRGACPCLAVCLVREEEILVLAERESQLGALTLEASRSAGPVRIDETRLYAPRYSRLFQDRGRRISKREPVRIGRCFFPEVLRMPNLEDDVCTRGSWLCGNASGPTDGIVTARPMCNVSSDVHRR
jgi:hypothetical protein